MLNILSEEQSKMDDNILNYMSNISNVKYSDEQLAVLKHRGGMCILACAGSGKALKNGTGVLTPNGYVPIETLKIGDTCYGDNGLEQQVVGVFPQGEKQVYEVHFSDRTVVECCEEHLWTYSNQDNPENYKTKTVQEILDTEELYKLYTDKNGKTHKVNNIHIPMTRPIKFSSKHPVLPPYSLGAILGRGLKYLSNRKTGDVCKRLNNELKNIKTSVFEILDTLGIWDCTSENVFIPDIYKYSSIRDRVNLLKGIIDTTGYYRSVGDYQLTVKSETFANDIKFVAESLGLTATKTTGNNGFGTSETFRLYITPSKDINKLHYSSTIGKDWSETSNHAKRSITKIVKTDRFAEMTCIKVSNENGLFIMDNCVVTHNTTLLTNLIAKRIQTGEIGNPSKLLCTTFSKSGADEMGQRLNQLLNKLGLSKNVNVRTLHSIYYSLLRDLQYNLSIIDNSDKMRYLREACKENDLQLEDDDYVTLDSILSFQINNLMSDNDIFRSYIYTLREKVSLEKYSKVRRLFNSKKQQHNCMDFDDMQLFVYNLFKSPQYGPALTNYCHSLWEYIYIDEAQDISKIQFEILKYLVSDPDKLVIIGDDDQSIYEWRGADPSIILNVCGVYTNLKVFNLTTNYRCRGDIVRKAAHGIQFNKIRSEKTMKPYEDGGEIRFCDCKNGNIFEMSKYAYKYIKQLIIDEGVNPSDIAVLSRNNQHLTVLNNMLFRDGIYCKSSDDMKFTKCSMFKMVDGIIKLGQNTSNGTITASNLNKCSRYMKAALAREIGKIQNSYGATLKDILGFVLTEYAHIYSLGWKNPGYKVSKFDASKYGTLFELTSREVLDDLVEIYHLLEAEDGNTGENLYKESVKGTLIKFLNSKASYFFKSEESMRFVSGYIEYLIYLVDKMGLQGYLRFIKAVEQFENGKMAVISPMVTLSTMHGAKGKEWKYVLIFADDNVSFPSFRNIQDCIKDGVPNSDIRRMIDENRRLHYVAMTRAKEHLIIFGNKRNLSIYTLESMGLINNSDSNASIITMSQHGLPLLLVDKVDKTLFSDDSGYNLEIDIKNLDTTVENIFYANLNENQTSKQGNNTGFNINSIQTYAPQTLGDD